MTTGNFLLLVAGVLVPFFAALYWVARWVKKITAEEDAASARRASTRKPTAPVPPPPAAGRPSRPTSPPGSSQQRQIHGVEEAKGSVLHNPGGSAQVLRHWLDR